MLYQVQLNGAQTGTRLIRCPRSELRMEILSVTIDSDTAVDKQIHRQATASAANRLCNLEAHSGEFVLNGPFKLAPGESLYFTGGVAAQDVNVVVRYAMRGSHGLGRMRVLIPWYNYPNWYAGEPSYVWPSLYREQDRNSDVVAIINPSSGPGGPTDPNADYIVGMDEMLAADVTMIGYVSTSFGARSLALVKADIDKWAADYSTWITGIFFDEVVNAHDKADVEYYREIVEYARAKGVLSLIVGNPGTDTFDTLQDLFDVTVSFEDTKANWDADVALTDTSRTQHAALIHALGADDMVDTVQEAFNRGYRYIYVTEDVLPNPWDTLCADWVPLTQHLRRLNHGE